MAAQVKPAWLEWMATLTGGTPRHTCASAFPPDRFYCLLDELPVHLVPARSRALLRVSNTEHPFVLHQHCVLYDAAHLPDSLATHPDLVSGFAKQGTVAWVSDDARGLPRPYWLGPRMEPFVRGLSAGDPRSTLSPTDAAILLGSGILRRGNQSRRDQGHITAKSRDQFRTRGYVPLADLIHPFHIAALRRYYRYMIRSGKYPLGDGQTRLRYFAHNEPVARFFHHQIVPTISAIAGRRIRPSYAYFASYCEGADLELHTDREQCEFTVSLCLDFLPEPERETPWPLRLETRSGDVTVYQALGDALLYRGIEIPHSRGVLGRGQSSTSLFFHYVSGDFEGRLD